MCSRHYSFVCVWDLSGRVRVHWQKGNVIVIIVFSSVCNHLESVLCSVCGLSLSTDGAILFSWVYHVTLHGGFYLLLTGKIPLNHKICLSSPLPENHHMVSFTKLYSWARPAVQMYSLTMVWELKPWVTYFTRMKGQIAALQIQTQGHKTERVEQLVQQRQAKMNT